MTRTRFVVASLALTLVVISASVAHAQQKAPDGAILISQSTVIGGLPGDTNGFPITITQPGLYRLTGNIVVPDANTSAIVITADHVTLDLNGFMISGPTVCTVPPVTCSPTGNGDGVLAEFPRLNTTVRNGTVNGMGRSGIAIESGRVERVFVSNNGFEGIHVAFLGIVSDSIATRNGVGQGIKSPTPGVLVNSVAVQNHFGFNTGNDTGAAHNVSRFNTSDNLGPALDLSGNICNNGALCP